VLTASAVVASGRSGELLATPLTDPPLQSVLCMATSAHKRPGPLMRHAVKLLTELALQLPHGRGLVGPVSRQRALGRHADLR
jgi:LysR family nitrogen assimilation transcriptional regulator